MLVKTVLRHVWIDGAWFGLLCLPESRDHDAWVRDWLKSLGVTGVSIEVGVPGSPNPQWQSKASRAASPQVELESDEGPTGRKP